jgi:hypothetical protein
MRTDGLVFAALLLTAWMAPARAQEAAPPGIAPAFTSAAQAQAYLTSNPTGARAEAAFRTVANSEIAAANPGFDQRHVALGLAFVISPGSVLSPEEVQTIINQTTPEIGARGGFF